MNDESDYDCPLCGVEFSGAACHSSCPMARGCMMVRCPRCGYEFVEDGFVVSLLKKLVPWNHRRSDLGENR